MAQKVVGDFERPLPVLVAMDKFRGTMSAGFVNRIVTAELYGSGDFDVATSMIADGGEGTVEAVIAGNSDWAPSFVRSVDCWGRRITAKIASKGPVVLTEAASVAGRGRRPGPWDEYWRDVGVPEEDLGLGTGRIIEPGGVGPRIWFQVVPEPKTVKNRLHLDICASGCLIIVLPPSPFWEA